MKVTKHSGSAERKVLTAAIVNNRVCGRLSSKYQKNLLGSRWGNLILGWCVSYYNKYGKAPGREVEDLFDQWHEEGKKDKETVQLVESYLSSISGSYKRLKKEINPDRIIDVAGTLFNKVRLQNIRESLEAFIESGEIDKAEALLQKDRRIEVGLGTGIDFLTDKEAVNAVFDENAQPPLIEFKGPMGKFFGNTLQRDSFVGIMGIEKVGKTWWATELGWEGMLQGRKVAFFQCGDMSQNQIMERLLTRAGRKPLVSGEGWPLTVKFPTEMTSSGGTGMADVTHEERVYDKPLARKAAHKAFNKLQKKLGPESPVKLSCHASHTISPQGIAAVIEEWARDGWTPDIVVIDYSDILAPPPGFVGESREKHNQVWMQLRSLSQTLHACVITPTQADAAGYKTKYLTRTNFSEDKRKLAHATAVFGVNADETEMEFGLRRLNWVVRRGWKYSESKCLSVAGAYELARPHILATF